LRPPIATSVVSLVCDGLIPSRDEDSREPEFSENVRPKQHVHQKLKYIFSPSLNSLPPSAKTNSPDSAHLRAMIRARGAVHSSDPPSLTLQGPRQPSGKMSWVTNVRRYVSGPSPWGLKRTRRPPANNSMPDKKRRLVDGRVHRDIEKADHHLFPALLAVAHFDGRIGVAGIVRGIVVPGRGGEPRSRP